MAGFIKLHRGWHDNEQFGEEVYCERAAWCWLLSNAAWKDTTQRNHKGEVVDVKRGQYHTSLRILADHWGWSIKRVRTFLKVLEKCGSVGTVGAQTGTIITICNYEEYQGTGHGRGSELGTVGARSGHTKEEGKERKKKETTSAGARPDDVSADLWEDFKTLRKAKKAPLTEGAIKGIRREAEKVGWSMQDAVEACVTNGWQGFQARYVGDRRKTSENVTADGWELPM